MSHVKFFERNFKVKILDRKKRKEANFFSLVLPSPFLFLNLSFPSLSYLSFTLSFHKQQYYQRLEIKRAEHSVNGALLAFIWIYFLTCRLLNFDAYNVITSSLSIWTREKLVAKSLNTNKIRLTQENYSLTKTSVTTKCL
ncbi:hypothetical protein RIR_jg21563.t1 [Rhizophagus irregularis DAOM 181602=DAOM 197198]|nr:hypothetical protein RIR_jg21563.t1 [Rhizophagus irregularis DAOM 181602=DAOM 197198]